MGLYRKKPVEIEAKQLIIDPDDNAKELALWCGGRQVWAPNEAGRMEPRIEIETLEGTMVALGGDWIIKGIKGEFYPCKPDIFEATYDLVRKSND